MKPESDLEGGDEGTKGFDICIEKEDFYNKKKTWKNY